MESEPIICSAPNSEGKSLLSGEGEVNNKDDDGLSDDFNVRTRPPTRGEASRMVTFIPFACSISAA